MTTEKSEVFSINISKTKGTPKSPVETAKLIVDLGLEGDAHAEGGIKQVSLLSIESINRQNACPKVNPVRESRRLKSAAFSNGVKNNRQSLKPGDFAENITTQGIALTKLKIGDKLTIGNSVVLEISKIGKDCHKYCAIYYKTGDCIMPREGIFAKVIKDGIINRGDRILVL